MVEARGVTGAAGPGAAAAGVGRRRPGSRRLGLLVLLTVAVLGRPSPALAHAALLESDPEPGSQLSSTPGVVTLRFTEPLNVRLSRAAVTVPQGLRFEGRASPGGLIRIPLSTNAPGVYRVEWVTVSTLDGHTLRGSFRFGVGVAPGEGAEGETSVAPGPADLLVAGLRALEYAALLFLAGGLLLERLGRRGGLGWVRPNLRAAAGVALLSGLGVVAGEASLAAPSPSVGAVAAFLGGGLAGGARVVRVAAEAALALVVAGGRRGAGILLAFAFVALAGAGHAAAVRPRLAGIAVDAFHLGSAGMWGGAILALGTLRPPGGWRSGEGRALLDGFSPIALGAFGVTVATGVLRGAQELATLRDLLTTSYGLVLLAKVGLVAVMAQLSALAWRRLPRSLLAEAAVAALVVGAAALLAAYPLPPARLAEAVEAAERPRATGVSALPQPGDLTMGGDAGQVLVGLTIRPGRPGINDVLVFLLPLEGEEAAAGLPATLRVGGRSLPLEDCGPSCRRTSTALHGGERLVVRVGGEIGGETSFRLPDLPAEVGSSLLDLAEQRMRALRTYRVEEALSSGLGATVRSRYAFQAPDRMRLSVRGEATIVRIGDIQYVREGPGGAWEVESAPRLSVPQFIWDSFLPPVAPRVVGRGRIDGRPVQVVSFFGSGDLPVWFRLWIGEDGLVRRAEMRALGHFMDQRYHAFDSGISIEPPGSGGQAEEPA